jgi:hypothetical protein
MLSWEEGQHKIRNTSGSKQINLFKLHYLIITTNMDLVVQSKSK